MEAIGYGSNNCILNLGTLYFLLVIYVFQVIFTILFSFYVHFTGKGKKFLKAQVEKLFFTQILVISLESFIEFYVTGYLQVTKPLHTTLGERAASMLGYPLLFIAFGFVPYAVITAFISKREKLEEPLFKRFYGPCYADIRLDNKW
jgi:hypothetical protein